MIKPSEAEILEPLILGMFDVDFLGKLARDLSPNWMAIFLVDDEGKTVPLAVLGSPAQLDGACGELKIGRISNDRAIGHLVSGITK